jgi:hypothetical protein
VKDFCERCIPPPLCAAFCFLTQMLTPIAQVKNGLLVSGFRCEHLVKAVLVYICALSRQSHPRIGVLFTPFAFGTAWTRWTVSWSVRVKQHDAFLGLSST